MIYNKDTERHARQRRNEMDKRKETVAKILELLDGLTYDNSRQILDDVASEKRNSKERRVDKFNWSPADVKVQDEQGNWIRGDEFLNRLK